MATVGAAAAVASLLVSFLRDVGPLGALLAIYILCVLLAEFLQHSAAVAMMFPIAVATANQVGSDPRPFVIAVAIACTCCFASPVAYQTHLMRCIFKQAAAVGEARGARSSSLASAAAGCSTALTVCRSRVSQARGASPSPPSPAARAASMQLRVAW